MKETDLQTLSSGISDTINEYRNSTTQAERGAALGNLQKLTNIVGNEEKRIDENALKQDQFQLNKDHVYAQDKLEENRFKQQVKDNSERNELAKKQFEQQVKDNSERNELAKKQFEQQVKDNSERNELERLKLEIEKMRLDMQREDLNQKKIDSRNDMRFRLITFGVTTVIGLAEVVIPLMVYRKLAYTNLNLIYRDEGRPSNDYKDAIKNVKQMIKR